VRGRESKLAKTESLPKLLLRFPFEAVESDVECGDVECAMQCGEQFGRDMVTNINPTTVYVTVLRLGLLEASTLLCCGERLVTAVVSSFPPPPTLLYYIIYMPLWNSAL